MAIDEQRSIDANAERLMIKMQVMRRRVRSSEWWSLGTYLQACGEGLRGVNPAMMLHSVYPPKHVRATGTILGMIVLPYLLHVHIRIF